MLFRSDNIEEIEEIVNTLDILILGGGGCMNYYWLAAHRLGRFASIIAPLIIGKRSNKKLITLGNTFGPWGNCKEFFEMLFQYLNFANLSVRDDLGSTSALAEIGQIGKISSIVDDLYFLQEELKIEKPKIINGKYIVLELYLSMREIEKQLTNIQEMVNGAKLYGVQVVFIAFGKKYGGEYQGQYLKDKIPDIVLYPSEEFVKIEDVRKLIQKAECVVCDRYHALVVSLSENTPCFMYLREIDSSRQYYFNKCYGLLQKKFANRFFDESEFLVLDLSIGLKRALDCTRINRQKVYFMDAENDLKLKCQRIKEIKKMIQFD